VWWCLQNQGVPLGMEPSFSQFSSARWSWAIWNNKASIVFTSLRVLGIVLSRYRFSKSCDAVQTPPGGWEWRPEEMRGILVLTFLSASLFGQTAPVQVISTSNPVSIAGSVTCNGGKEDGDITFTNTSKQPIMALYAAVNTHCISGGNRIFYRHDQYFKHGPLAVGEAFDMAVDVQTGGSPVQATPATVEVQAVQFGDGTWWGDPSFPVTIQAERTAIRNFLGQLTTTTSDADFTALLDKSRADKTLRFMVGAIRMAEEQTGIASARAKAQDYLANGNSRTF